MRPWSSSASGVPSCDSSSAVSATESTPTAPTTCTSRSASNGEKTATSTRPMRLTTRPPATARPMSRLRERRVNRRTSSRSVRRRSREARRSSTRSRRRSAFADAPALRAGFSGFGRRSGFGVLGGLGAFSARGAFGSVTGLVDSTGIGAPLALPRALGLAVDAVWPEASKPSGRFTSAVRRRSGAPRATAESSGRPCRSSAS